MTTVAASKVREEFADVLNRVAYQGERVVLERHGKGIAALVPLEDLELLRTIEDQVDLADARAALAEARKKGTKPLQTLKKQLGL